MTQDQASTTQKVAAPRRVAVIGNSFIGALRKACLNSPELTRGLGFSFYARAGSEFSTVRIDDGLVCNVSYFDDQDFNIAGFDHVLVYGDFPLPQTVREFAGKVTAERYSEQLLRARLREWFSRYFTSFRLVQSLVALNGPSVFVVSRNFRAEEVNLFDADYRKGIELIAGMIGPAVYVPAPEGLFADDGHPREEFYAGSLDMKGDEPDRALQPEHHLAHLNESGGRAMLERLVEWLAAAGRS